jgi:copper transport protein
VPSRPLLVVRYFCAVIAGFLVALSLPSVASAHATLDGTTPAASSVVSRSPDEIVLDFDETVEPRLGSLRLFDDGGREMEVGDLLRDAVDQSVVRASVAPLPDGPYVVVWRVTSADGHPVTGAFPFEVGKVSTGSTSDLLESVVGSLPRDESLGVAIGVIRFFSLLAITLLIGVLVVTAGSEGLVRQRSRLVTAVCLTALAASSIGILLLQGPYTTNGGWGDVFDAGLMSDVMSTRLGVALLARVMLVFVLVMLFSPVVMRRRSSLWLNAVSLATIGLVVTFSASGHASARPWAAIIVALDAVHLLAIGAWIGALMAMFVVGREAFGYAEEDGTAGHLVRLSRIFTWAMPTVVVTGAVQAWMLIDDRSGVLETTYGRAFLAKVGLVVFAVAIGTGIRRRLAHGNVGVLRRALLFEVFVAVVVLGLAAVMVSTSPTSGDAGSASSSVTLVQGGVLADITVSPARVGTVEIHTLFSPPGGSLSPVDDVEVRLELPSRDIPAIPVDMIELGPNHWSGVAQIPYSGEWTLDVVVAPAKNATLSYSTVVKVVD